MKANELMIGDFVTWKDCQHDEKPMVIEIVGLGWDGDEDEALVCINGSRGCDVIGIDEEISGIPLTPEILEKNGFNGKYKLSYQYDKPEEDFAFTYISYWKGRLSIRVSPDIRRKHSTNVMHINCDYVHQLQHAFRLCGIEKDIVL